jgi:hypothetical protein
MQTAGGSASGYIEDQNSSDQAADFRIGGDGTVKGALGVGAQAALGSSRVLIHDASGTAGELQLLVRDNASLPILAVEDIGRVGIGTSSPAAKLHVENNTIDNSIQDLFRLQMHNSVPGSGGGIQFRNRWNGGGTYWTMARITAIEQNGFGGQLVFSTNFGDGAGDDTTPEAMRIDEKGYVGIGTTTPSEKLEVNGNIELSGGDMDLKVSSGYLDLRTNDTDHGLILRTHTGANTNWGGIRTISGGKLQLRADGGSYDQLVLIDGGNVGIGTSNPTYRLHVSGRLKTSGINETSDIRLKKNIKPINGALENVLQMNGVTYDWRTDEFPEMGLNDDSQHGLIAQELEAIVPELVLTGSDGYKSIEYTHLVPVLIEALKEQNKIIEVQASEISIIKSEASITQKQLKELINQVNGYSSNDY